MIMDFIQPGTNLGMFLQIIASLKTVPPRMFRIVPLGDFHIFFKLNSESQIILTTRWVPHTLDWILFDEIITVNNNNNNNNNNKLQ